MTFDKIVKDFAALQVAEKKGKADLLHYGDIAKQCLVLLREKKTRCREQGQKKMPSGTVKLYDVLDKGKNVSRPINRALFLTNPDEFWELWQNLTALIQKSHLKIDFERLDETLYTACVSFAAVYDLYKNKSRKTPGTYLEMLMNAMLGALTKLPTAKQISLESGFRVPTDIVLKGAKGKPSLVIPTKITTRERIVQVFVHQLILNIEFPNQYKSVLVAVSEIKRTEGGGVEEICVPGQVAGFQKHLARVHGLYYADVPAPYASEEFQKIVPVRPLSSLFSGDLIALLEL